MPTLMNRPRPAIHHNAEEPGTLQLKPSALRPNCMAGERLFKWIGVNRAPASIIDDPTIRYLVEVARRESLRDTTGYGSGLRKFHLFCDAFSVPESKRLPASFEVLHSFALWAAADPELLDPAFTATSRFEPISVAGVRKYLAAIRAWHITQGWPAPLTEDNFTRINWSLRGLENLQACKRKRPLRPPITFRMLTALKASLDLNDSFDACAWAMAACAFWGMMRFGEVSVTSRGAFMPSKHLKRRDVRLGHDLNGKYYACLSLPSAKTAKPGEIQSVFLVRQETLCPIEALHNLARVTPAGPEDPLFSWLDKDQAVRPMVRNRALHRINTILMAWGWGSSFGHSFRIGGASFFLAKKVNPEIVRIAGRWRSLAYETYIRAFEQIASQHLAVSHT
jgi:hypothetical protein